MIKMADLYSSFLSFFFDKQSPFLYVLIQSGTIWFELVHESFMLANNFLCSLVFFAVILSFHSSRLEYKQFFQISGSRFVRPCKNLELVDDNRINRMVSISAPPPLPSLSPPVSAAPVF